MALVQVTVPYKENYDYGIGVDLASSSPMGKVVEGAISGVTGAGGATTSYNVERIHTTSDLETKLGIDAKASYGCGAFAGASARFSFAQSSKVQSSSLFMTITANVTLEVQSIDDPSLTAAAAQLASQPDAFAARYGNMFVRSVGRGGLFVGVIQIDTSSSDESEAISAQLQGSYGLFSGEAKTNFESVQKKYHSEIRLTVYHEGGPIDLTMKDITDAAQLYSMLQDWLKSFQDHPEQNAKPYYVALAPVVIANGPIPPNAAEIEHAQDVLVLCAKERSEILDGMNMMEFIMQHPSRYDFAAPTTPADIAKAFRNYQFDLDLVASAASQAINDPSKAMTPAAFASAAGKVYPQGVPPTPMPTLEKGLQGILAAKGEAMASNDPLVAALRDLEPAGPSRVGFDIGMAAVGEQTLWGPGKQAMVDALSPEEQMGFMDAANFSMERNRNASLAATGVKIANANPAIAAARKGDPFYILGFDIATGIFGDPALGALGNTLPGPGSAAIRDALHPAGQRGFNDSMALNLKSRK